MAMMMSFGTVAKSQQFLNELAQFYRNKGQLGITSQHLVARLNGQSVNLWDLYSSVLEMGGSYKVNQMSRWDQVYAKLFKSTPNGVNVSVALRQIYQRFLMPYEKVNCANFTNDMIDDEDEDSRTAARDTAQSFVLHSSYAFPRGHPHAQLVNGPTSAQGANPLNKLYCSLVSGLPNEMDFALGVLTTLASSRDVDGIADFRLIEILLECYTLYSCCCEESPSPSIPAIAADNIAPDSGVDEMDCSDQSCNTSSADTTVTSNLERCPCLSRFWSRQCNDETVTAIVFESADPTTSDHASHTQDKIYKRVLRIAELVRTLSFSIEQLSCETTTCAPLSLLKFVALLLTSDDTVYNAIGLDIISNIATLTASLSESDAYSALQERVYRRIVTFLLTSTDLHCLSRAIEVLTRLLTTGNDEITKLITQLLDNELSERLIELLTCQHDVAIVIATLEFCLAMSESYPRLLLHDNKHLVKILLNLLNCEASKHFSISALTKVKVDTSGRGLAIKSPALSAPVNQSPLKVITNQPAPTPPSSGVTDNESFALNWLRSSYDPAAEGTRTQPLRITDLYSEYVKHCCRNGRKNVIAAQPFTLIIKKAFLSCTIIGGTHVDGLLTKSAPTTPTKQPPSSQPAAATPKPGQLASPILKAHLSAPPRGPATVAVTTTAASPTTTTTSTLIKSLLANKLRNNTAAATTVTTSAAPVAAKSTPSVTPAQNSVSTVVAATSPAITVNPVKPPQTTPSSVLAPVEPAVIETIVTASPSSGMVVTKTVTFNSTPASTAAGTPSVTSNHVSSTVSLATTPTGHTFLTTSTGNQSVLVGSPQVVTSTAQGGHAPQQYILVRTIGAGGQHQQNLVSINSPSGSGPIRLILPSAMLSQQRPVTAVNGIPTHPIINQATSAVTVSQASQVANNCNSNDILMKAVLGSGIGSDAPASPPAGKHLLNSNTKHQSSPLLNVLLDKGKLPEAVSSAAGTPAFSNSVTTTPTCNNVVTVSSAGPQQQKMYILTTKSGVPLKTISSIQQNNIGSTPPVVQNSPKPVPNCNDVQPVVNCVTPVRLQPQSDTQVNQAKTNHVVAPITNGELSPPPQNHVDNVNHKKGGPTNSNDLSPIKDIQKTVEDAAKLINKRPNDSTNNESGTSKKAKVNCVMSANSVTVTTKTVATNGETKVIPTTTPVQPVATATVPTTTVSSNTDNSSINTTTSVAPSTPSPAEPPPIPKPLLYFCEWTSCTRSFMRAVQVFKHVCEDHVLVDKTTPLTTMMSCEWGGAGGQGPGCQSKRPKLSLLTHIQDFHCNPLILHQIAVRNQQHGHGTSAPGLPQPPPAHPGYAQNAALLAIRRHAVNYVEAPTLPPITPTTPITVSIRLTAALVLRNLADQSSVIKSVLRSYEPYLSELCVSEGRDESRTIAQCLAVILEKGRSS